MELRPEPRLALRSIIPCTQGLRRFVPGLESRLPIGAGVDQVDFERAGFQWIDCNDSENSVVSFVGGRGSADYLSSPS